MPADLGAAVSALANSSCGGRPGDSSGVGRGDVGSAERNRLRGLTRWKKLRLATFGPVALAGTDEVVIKGSAGEASFGGGALATSCVRFAIGSAGGFGTSTFARGALAITGAGFGTLVAAAFGGLVAAGLCR